MENGSNGPMRGYMDMCLDLMHSGHYNAIRQAKQLCDSLVIGIHSDAEIMAHKGPPVYTQAERYAMLDHIRWVDATALDVPYSPSLGTLKQVGADFGIHGDDMPLNAQGRSAYQELADAGKLRIIPRTYGISTTALIARLMSSGEEKPERSLIATAQLLRDFTLGMRKRTQDDSIVYIDGAFDLFNVGHASTLNKARQLGTYLVVGIFDDETVNRMKGVNYPIMNLHERVLNVCSCKWVDDVVIGAPADVTEEFVRIMNISIVVEGSLESVRHAVPKSMGIYRRVESEWPKLTPAEIRKRLMKNESAYVARNNKREELEIQYYNSKKA